MRQSGHRSPLRWPTEEAEIRRLAPGAPVVRLLEVDDDLADALGAVAGLEAHRALAARVADLPGGRCELAALFEATRGGLGLLIVSGLLSHETCVGDRTTVQLLGPGDLLRAPDHLADELLHRDDAFRVLEPTRLAVLDRSFAERASSHPQAVFTLMARSGRQLADLDTLRAIACQPRLEVRLVLVLWHLSTRWGRVEASGIRLRLPLTHRLLGQLVGAERPSISHALARLAQANHVVGQACDLHLVGTLSEHLAALLGRGPDEAPAEAMVDEAMVREAASAA